MTSKPQTPVTTEAHLHSFLSELRRRMPLPNYMQVVKHNSLYFVGISDDRMDDSIISEDIYQGCDCDLNTATLKAFVEMVERKAFLLNYRAQAIVATSHPRSDGFAAFPCVVTSKALASNQARENALLEAFERFVWANWWDNEGIAHKILDCSELDTPELHSILSMNTFKTIEKIQVVMPKVLDIGGQQDDIELLILLSWFKGGGCITGGAAGRRRDRRQTIIHGLNELVRHITSLGRFASEEAEPTNLYHKRLLHFGFGFGDSLVKARLEKHSTNMLHLPELTIDEEINHSLADICVVWRCLYKNQPVFMGDDNVDRLCI